VVLYRDDGDGIPADLAASGALDLSWSGGVDIAAVNLEAAASLPPAPVLVQPVVDGGELRWIRGQPMPLQWLADGDAASGDEVWVTLLGDRHWLQGLAVGTTVTLSAETIEDAVENQGELRLARTRLVQLDAGPGTVWLRVTAEIRLELIPIGVLQVVPPVIELAETLTVEVTHNDGTFAAGQTVFDLGEGIEIVDVNIPGGSGPVAEVTLTVAPGAPTGPRSIGATIAGESLSSADALMVLLPAADRCPEAFVLLRDGMFHGDLGGLADDYDDPSICTGLPATGADAVYAIEVVEGEVLAATLDVPQGDASLYLVTGCDTMTSPVACADLGGSGVPETLSHAPDSSTAGTLLLVVDLFDELPQGAAGDFTLQLDLETLPNRRMAP
jgi:hypothetical protein